MRFVLTIVEQLDRAARELKTDHPINNRLALILVDNATELMLHRQCTNRLELDSFAGRIWKAYQAIGKGESAGDRFESSEKLRQDIMTAKQRANAKSKFLDDKLKVLGDMGDLTATEKRFISVAHSYRNELYHIGLSHEDIIRAISGRYFLLCCDLFVRIGNEGFFGPSFSSNDEYTDVAKHYLQSRDGRVLPFDVDKGALAEKLRGALPDRIPDLPKTLGASARKSIGALMDDFAFLTRDNPFRFDADKMLEVAQWQRDLTEALESENVDGLWIDPNYRESFYRVAATLEANWQQRHALIPRDRWMLRADAIEREADPLVAMDSYQSLRNDMSYLEEAIESASIELDKWIQQEIDRARGK